jgi:plastocyanin
MLMKRTRLWFAIFAMISLLSLSFACGGTKKEDEAANSGGTDTGGAKYTATGKEGTIKGKIALNGSAPAPQKIDMNQDAACAAANPNGMTETVVAKDGKLQYAFVYIKDGTTADGKKIGDYKFDVPTTPVKLDQEGCHYKPHVLGLQTGQKLSIVNSDKTTHNVHPTPKVNAEWNQTQASGAPPIEKTFTRAETLIPVKCNQHPWMKAYVGVLSHPFFAVSGEDGSFEIKGVPPGTYTVVAWQEKYGESKPMQVKVDANGSATADFAFDAAATTAALTGGGLELLPALDLPMIGKF